VVFQKGHKGNPKGRGKGTLNKATLTKLERRAIFDKKVSEKWEKTIDQLPPVYIADQFLGKAPEKVEQTLIVQIEEELADKYHVNPTPKNNSERHA